MEIQRRAHREQRDVEPRAVLVHPDLLARAAEPDEQDVRAARGDPRGQVRLLGLAHPAEPGRHLQRDPQARILRLQLAPELRQDGRLVAVEADREPGPRRHVAHVQHQRRSAHAVAHALAIQRVQRPAHRLPIRQHHVQRVQPSALHRVQRPGHHAVHGKRRDRQGPPLAGRLTDSSAESGSRRLRRQGRCAGSSYSAATRSADAGSRSDSPAWMSAMMPWMS